MKKIIWILCFILFWAGCSRGGFLESETNQVVEDNTSEALSPTLIVSPAPPGVLPPVTIDTLTSTLTPTVPPSFHVIVRSASVESNSTQINFHGRIILTGTVCDSHIEEATCIWDFDENSKLLINADSNLVVDSCSISPNRKTLALLSNNSTNNRKILQIFDNQGELLSEEDVTYTDWNSVDGWYDNNHIILSTWEYQNGTQIPGSTIIYNPFSRRVQNEYSILDYPNALEVYIDAIGRDHYTTSMAVYSPDFQFVIYFLETQELALYNLSTQDTLLARGPVWEMGPPQWLLNNQSFITDLYTDIDLHQQGIYREDFFFINVEGDVQRFSFLSSMYDSLEIDSFTLSPDEQQIAFWVRYDPEQFDFQLAVMNIYSGMVKIYENITFDPRDTFGPWRSFWDPESNRLLITTRTGENVQVLLVDVLDDTGIVLAENTNLLGWLYDDTP